MVIHLINRLHYLLFTIDRTSWFQSPSSLNLENSQVQASRPIWELGALCDCEPHSLAHVDGAGFITDKFAYHDKYNTQSHSKMEKVYSLDLKPEFCISGNDDSIIIKPRWDAVVPWNNVPQALRQTDGVHLWTPQISTNTSRISPHLL